MFIESYNGVPHETGTAKGGLSTEYEETGYRYIVNGVKQNTGYNSRNEKSIDQIGYNKMYGRQELSDNLYWYLASPSSYNTEVCYVDTAHGTINRFESWNTPEVKPVVCLKKEINIEIEEQ